MPEEFSQEDTSAAMSFLMGTAPVAPVVIASPASEAVDQTNQNPASINKETTPAATSEAPNGEGEGAQNTDNEKKDEKPVLTEKERNQKKEYLSQINKLQKELEEKNRLISERQTETEKEMNGKYKESGTMDDINKIVDLALHRKDLDAQTAQLAQAERVEKDSFIRENPELKDELAEIEAVREQFPNMSYDAAAKLHLATSKPELLIKKTGVYNPTPMNSSPASISPDEMSPAELGRGLQSYLMGR